MARLLAPYSNGMRLGQGFNSYTQQICLDRAVLENTQENWNVVKKNYGSYSASPVGTSEAPPGSDQSLVVSQPSMATQGSASVEPHPERSYWTKPQVVTYSSRFVNKLSDVTNSMNISGAMAIQTATIGGHAKGSYVDSDKFQESDLNFHLQVKVTNQILEAPQYNLFNKIENVASGDFTAIYGDCFISGWEEGGELDAIISMKVSDKSKITDIKGKLEAEVHLAALSGSASGKFSQVKDDNSSSTETTVAVNWSGGGSIKDPEVAWTIESITAAAAGFPEMVALCPQRTNAILTKYSALESFQRQQHNFNALDYESAGIYTSSLLDHFMEYKLMWKQIALAIDRLDRNKATIEWSKITYDMLELAVTSPLPPHQIGQKLRQSKPLNASPPAATASAAAGPPVDQTGENQPAGDKPTDDQAKASVGHTASDPVDYRSKWPTQDTRYRAFTPSFAGLIQARKVCRTEMVKLVNEVDLVTKDPSYADDPTRDEYFLDPLIFKQLLPIVKSLPSDMKQDPLDDTIPIILGYTPPPVVNTIDLPILCSYDPVLEKDADPQWLDSVAKLRQKATDYRMFGAAGQVGKLTVKRGSKFFNDLEFLNPTYRPVSITVWHTDYVEKISITYANGESVAHGMKTPSAQPVTLTLAADGSEVITAIDTKAATTTDGTIYFGGIWILTSLGRHLHFNVDKLPTKMSWGMAYTWMLPDLDERWSIRGLFGYSQPSTDGEGPLCGLGIVYGKDSFVPIPSRPLVMTLNPGPYYLTDEAQEKLYGLWLARPQLCGKFIMTGYYTPRMQPIKPSPHFNCLDRIGIDWKVKSITSTHSSTTNRLSGLRVVYTNGQIIDHGVYGDGAANRTANFDSDIISCRVRLFRDKNAPSTAAARIHSVEFILGTNRGKLPNWAPDVSPVTFSGNSTSDAVEAEHHDFFPPKLDGLHWTVRGFYGWQYTTDETTKTTEIDSLGIVWGCG